MKNIVIILIVLMSLAACQTKEEPAIVAEKWMNGMYSNKMKAVRALTTKDTRAGLDDVADIMANLATSGQKFDMVFSRDSISNEYAWVWWKDQEGVEEEEPTLLMMENGKWLVIFVRS